MAESRRLKSFDPKIPIRNMTLRARLRPTGGHVSRFLAAVDFD